MPIPRYEHLSTAIRAVMDGEHDAACGNFKVRVCGLDRKRPQTLGCTVGGPAAPTDGILEYFQQVKRAVNGTAFRADLLTVGPKGGSWEYFRSLRAFQRWMKSKGRRFGGQPLEWSVRIAPN